LVFQQKRGGTVRVGTRENVELKVKNTLEMAETSMTSAASNAGDAGQIEKKRLVKWGLSLVRWI